MINRKELSSKEYEEAWDFVYKVLQFNLSNEDLIKIPFENKSYNISKFYDDNFEEELYDDLHDCSLEWFKKISKGNRMFALNWQHKCYSFSPELPFEKDEFNEWLISVFPNGDYVFFLFADFKNGVFVDGINKCIHLFGTEALDCLKQHKPKMFK